MKYLHFEWDPNKNQENKKKHKIAFEEAKTVFYNENARLIFDPDHSEKEERFILLGFSEKFRMLIVVHCYRKNEEVVRIISARKATKKEQNQYSRF